MTLQEFLTRFGEPLAQRVTETFNILHDPVRDLGTTPDLDQRLATLLHPCYPAQGEAAKALARAYFEEGQQAALLSGEMGVGKCEVTLALVALAPRPLRTLIMCPPHLVPKWEREATAVLPEVRVISLGGPDSLAHLTGLATVRRTYGRKPPAQHEVWVLGRERAKLHHAWRPAYAGRLMYRLQELHNPTGPTRDLQVWREPACLRCGAVLRDKAGVPLTVEALDRKHTFCPQCHEPAFCADRNGPRRYAPAEFIKRHLKGAFDLVVADEVHEMKGESTGQGNAFGALAAAGRTTLGLTGTLLGGYADNLFYILYRMFPTDMVREGLDYRKVQTWMERYGILERVTKISADDDASEDMRAVRGKTKRTSVRRKPGISPLILGKHLLPNTVFLRLADVADALPPYEERVISLDMSPGLADAYHQLEDDLLACVREALASGSRHLLSMYLQSLLCYPDQAAFREEHLIDPRTKKPIAFAPIVPGPLPKEEELVDLCMREVREKRRRVLVYVTFTDTRDLTGRVKELLETAGLRAQILRGTVPPPQREHWIQERVNEGIDVLIANPELVKTGLDLYAFPTFIYLCPGYNIYTLRQAARRAWRIGQTEPCEVIFLTYANSMQSKALTLIATKLEASLAIEGELSDNGLSALADTSDSLVLELARALVSHVGEKESAEAVWARLRKRDLEQFLTLTAAKPKPPVVRISQNIETIGEKMLIVDLIEQEAPRHKKVSRLEVKKGDLQQVLSERPHLAQLAFF